MTELSQARWFKSSRSAGQDACVEVAHLVDGHVGVRDSKDPSGPTLRLTPSAWDALLTATRDGHFTGR